MNRTQFLLFAGKLRKLATQLDVDARRVRVTGHPGDELAEDIRAQAENIRRIAGIVEARFS